jgi:ATP-dependent Lhr-like helicase
MGYLRAMDLGRFHPVVQRWFTDHFGEPTVPQREGWPRIAAGDDTLIAAPTGSGKTLAAFLFAIDDLVKRGLAGALQDQTLVLYVSPLKALSNDVSKNLARPLAELREVAASMGLELPEIRVAVRTGDTPVSERAKMAKKPPHILVTTPESLYILLTSERARERLQAIETVILDEVHAIAGDKRGAHLTLTIERLDHLIASSNGGRRPQRIGLSATQKPIEEIARLLTGARPPPVIVDAGFSRELDLGIEVPSDELGAVATHEMMAEVYDRIAELSKAHRTTLVFVNTRRLVERVAHYLSERIGEDKVAAHHGSLSRKTRLEAEQRLKRAEVKVAVATASLELGIDIGAVELVIQIGSPRSIATFLQRVGRSGHSLGKTPKGRLFALTRDQLVESAALVLAVRKGELDAIRVPDAPLDVLAQQIVAAAACEEWDEEALFHLVRRAHPYRNLARKEFDRVIEMLAEGIAEGKGRWRTYLHRDRIHGKVRARQGARLTAIMSGGAIPDNADYQVIAEPDETFVGTLHEDFAIESSAGDIFLLGNTSWRIRRVEAGRVRVENANGAPPTIPFWIGEAPARTKELSREVSLLREAVEYRLERGDRDEAIVSWIEAAASMQPRAAAQVTEYLAGARNALGALPTQKTIIAERFFDEAGGMQLVIHSPFGGRINRAWGLALRKRFCRSFNFELQAAATDDGIVISLGPMHSFPLETVFSFLSPETVEEVLTQAVLAAPIFGVRWRWNVQRALAVPRHQGGKKVPPPILRMRTDDLLSAVFPTVQACAENVPPGDIQLPDHPLIEETIDNCLNEAMDVEGLRMLLEAMRSDQIRLIARDTTEPSPISHEILNANPYAYLDDAPLEERRARAVSMRRRGLHPELAEGIGALDMEAIRAVEEEAEPAVRNKDELHDLLLSLQLLVRRDEQWEPFFAELLASGRATHAIFGDHRAWVAAERVPLIRSAVEGVRFDPELPPLPFEVAPIGHEDAMVAIVRGHMEQHAPTTEADLAAQLGLPASDVGFALHFLEAEGTVLRGQFTPGRASDATEWCDRRILSRIHRRTIGRLRKEIEPVTPADLMRFLFRWQHVAEGTQLSGPRGTLEVLAQLEGLQISATAWERHVLPMRIKDYDPSFLDALSFQGEITWGRIETRDGGDGAMLSRSIPIAILLRENLTWMLARDPTAEEKPKPQLSAGAEVVLSELERRGACFFRDLHQATKRLPAEVEDALRELVSAGLVTADGYSSLRALLDRTLGEVARPMHMDRFDRTYRLSPSAGAVRTFTLSRPLGSNDVGSGARIGGRWSLLRSGVEPTYDVEAIAHKLLLRYGVVFRDLLGRESQPIAWRDLLVVFRRMEARGELRGGRFVGGFVGEQYALPEAVEALRAIRRRKADAPQEIVRVAGTDPLNLSGIVTPGPRVPAVSGNAVLYRDGVAIASREAGRLVVRHALGPGESVDLELRVHLRPREEERATQQSLLS